jgi:hypothetical protein
LLLVMFLVGCSAVPPPDDDDPDAGMHVVEDAGPHDAGPPPPGCDFEPPTACPDPPPRYVDVEPIFVARCQVCHSAAGGEWPLVTYGHIADWAQDIHDLVLNCSMPPPDAGVPITIDERVQILAWIACGLPE